MVSIGKSALVAAGAAMLITAFGWLAPAQAGDIVEKAEEAEARLAAGDARGAHDALREAYRVLWTSGPLFMRRVVPVTEPAIAYGAFEARENTVYSGDEPIRLYIEPVGYSWLELDGGFSIGFDVDVEITAESGAVIWGRKDIFAFEQALVEPTFEFFETLTFDFAGLPAGDYEIVTTLRDQASEKSVTFNTAITIE